MERKLDVSVVVALKQHKKIQSISGAPATLIYMLRPGYLCN
jgi:hypothetical protein